MEPMVASQTTRSPRQPSRSLRAARRPARRSLAALACVAAPLGAVAPAAAQLEFVEVGAERGILEYDAGIGYGTGAAVSDYDDDGDLDVFVPNGPGTADQLYRNLGGGHFEEIAAAVGVAGLGGNRTGLWIDFDGDGRLDLIVAGDCYAAGGACFAAQTIHFHRQLETGAFEDLTAVLAPSDDGVTALGQFRSGLCGGDLNDDGWLDAVVGLWQGGAKVLMNDAGRGFFDVSDACGIAGASNHHFQPAIHDFDGDGWRDVYWAIDYTENRLWRNQRDGTFVDVAPAAGLDNVMNDMGMTLGDYDGDGDFDVYVTNITEFENHNVLYRNDSTGPALAFAEVAVESGVAETSFGWGTTFLDADNDGLLDLAVTNGWYNGVGYHDRSRFFVNLGTQPPTFEERGAAVGFDDDEWGASLVAFDMDRDGDLDLLQTCNLGGPLRLLENRRGPKAAANHFLVIQPRMDPPNAQAIGAVVRVEAGGATLMRLITAGTSFLGQEPAEAHVGMGRARVADRVTIAWPDGAQTILRDVAGDRVLDVRRSPCAGTVDLDGDGAIGFVDLVLMLGDWGTCPAACAADVNESGAVDAEDLVILLGRWGPCE
jgi:hypothetical protein